MHTRSITHLFVDLDGTLVGNLALPMSLKFARLSLVEIKRRVPHLSNIQALKTLLGIGPTFKKRTSDATVDVRVINYFSKMTGLSPIESRAVLKKGVFEIFPQIRRCFYPIPGAREFLEWAKGKYDLTLATNPVWPEEIIALRAQWGGININNFQFVTHIRVMSACKPSHLYYKEILQARNVKPENVLFIGNDLHMDLPATEVGIPVFILGKKAGYRPLHTTGAPAWTGSFKDLKTLLLTASSPAHSWHRAINL